MWTSGYVASPVMKIVDAAEHVDGRVKIQVVGEPDFQDGHTLHVRIDGNHGVTDRAHPGNGNDLPVEDLGGGWAAIGTSWVAGSTFRSGRCWHSPISLLNSRPILAQMRDEIWRLGGGSLKLPFETCALQETFIFREFVDVIGRGPNSGGFFGMDDCDGHLLQAVTGDFTARNFPFYHNRQNQNPNAGLHGLRLGVDGAETANVRLLDIWGYAAAGYMFAGQASGSFVNCHFRIRGKGCESDFLDVKNRDDSNFGNVVEAEFEDFGLYRIGIDGPAYPLQTNPFTMTAGSSVVTVAHPSNNLSIGIKVTFNGGLVRGVNMSATGTITAKVSGGYRVQMGEQASSSGTGGGSGVSEWASQFSTGDAGLDLRGKGWDVPYARATGDMRGRSAFRFRPGSDLSPNGTGAVYSSAGRLYAVNTHASRTNANGLTIGGRGVKVATFQGENFNQAINFQTNTQSCEVTSGIVHDCNTGGALRGNSNRLGLSAQTCVIGLAIQIGTSGGAVVDRDYLPEDAFTTTPGSAVVNVYLPGHGHETGDDVSFSSATTVNDIDPNNDDDNPTWEITKVDADNFTFTALNVATDPGPDGSNSGGGENTIYSFGATQTGLGLVAMFPSTRGCTTGTSIGAGATGAKLIGRSSLGDTTPITDLGTGTVDI